MRPTTCIRRFSGTVQSVEVLVGDKVKAGDELFTVDDASLRSTVRQANAALSQARQGVSAADQQVSQARLMKLQATNALSKLRSLPATMAASSAQIKEAKRSVKVADAGLASADDMLTSANIAKRNAEKSYRDARRDLKKATVLAPGSGVVTAVNIAEGGSVSTGGSVSSSSMSGSTASALGAASTSAATGSSAPVVISDNSVLIARVAVNEVDIADLKAGQEATVTFDAAAGLSIPATVRWVSPNSQTTGNIHTYDVELELASQSKRLRPGMTASADITTLKLTNTLLIPKTAVRVDGTTKYVTVVNADGTQTKRSVTTGRSDELDIQVLTGLKAAEKIATSFVAPAAPTGTSMMPPRTGAAMGGN